MNTAKRIVDAMCVVALVVVLVTLAGGWFNVAKADPVPDNNPRLYVKVIAPLVHDHGTHLRVGLSNGRWDVLNPCRYEDGRHCYWVGSAMGNGNGRDFIVTAGRVYYLDLSWVPRT